MNRSATPSISFDLPLAAAWRMLVLAVLVLAGASFQERLAGLHWSQLALPASAVWSILEGGVQVWRSSFQGACAWLLGACVLGVLACVVGSSLS